MNIDDMVDRAVKKALTSNLRETIKKVVDEFKNMGFEKEEIKQLLYGEAEKNGTLQFTYLTNLWVDKFFDKE